MDSEIYDAIVVPSVLDDPTKSGAVRARIFGSTDTLEDDEQPWVQPDIGKIAKVPPVGTYLKVYFKNGGDRSFPVYISQAISDGNYLPDNYRDEYPNVTETDMGMRYYYNESTNEYMEYDAVTGYQRRVSPGSDTSVSTNNSFSYDNDNNRVDNARVVTEDMVNICTGRPIRQGSTMYRVPSFNEPEIQITGGTAAQQ